MRPRALRRPDLPGDLAPDDRIGEHRAPRQQAVVLEHEATVAAGPRTARPSSSTCPLLAASSPATMRRNVVLPQPDGPTSAMNSPRSTARSMPRSASDRRTIYAEIAVSPDFGQHVFVIHVLGPVATSRLSRQPKPEV